MDSAIDSVYLDCHSTTAIDPEVLDIMVRCFKEDFGNAGSSQHFWGQDAAELVEDARSNVANVTGFEPDEVVFTSGATESNNLAILGLANGLPAKNQVSHGPSTNGTNPVRNEIVTVGIEHPSVLEPIQSLEKNGWVLKLAPVYQQNCGEIEGSGKAGQVNIDAFKKLISEKTAFVSIAMANNEIGVIQPIKEIGQIAHQAGAMVHADVTQGMGWLPCDRLKDDCDLVSFSAHKIYGPKGTGALCVNRSKLERLLKPIIFGGGQEFGFRSGTINTPGIAGLGKACRLLADRKNEDSKVVGELRDLLWNLLCESIPGLICNGPDLKEKRSRLPNNLNVQLPGVSGDTLIAACPSVAMSSGSACATAHQGPSHVLKAVGLSDSQADCSLRLGLGRNHSRDQIYWAADRIATTFSQLGSS